MRSVHRRLHSALLAFGALTACQHTNPAPVAKSAARAPVARAPLVRVGSVTAMTKAPARAEPSETSPFVEGVRLGYSAGLTVTGPSALLYTQKLLLGIHDDRVTVEPALLEGVPPGIAELQHVVGNTPDATWAVTLKPEERTSRSSLSRWTGSEWENADSLLQGGNVIGISSWSGGRTLALVSDEYAGKLNFVQLGGARNVPLPQLDRAARNSAGCSHGIQPTAMTALPSGEVFLVGMRCTPGPGEEVVSHGVAVEYWKAGQVRGKFSALPRLAEQEASAVLSGFVAASGNDVFVTGVRLPSTVGQNENGEAYLAHFDGQAWRGLPAPPTDRLDGLQRSPDGKLWALANGDLWTMTRSSPDAASWQPVAMPRFVTDASEHGITSFWVRDTGDVWATLTTKDGTYLLRTKRGAQPLTVPSDAQVAALSEGLEPGSIDNCEAPALVLLTFSRQAPKDADMPRARAALRGHSELEGKAELVELPFRTRRYLAIRGDIETLGLALLALSEAKIPGVNPELRCLTAPPTRVLPVDFGSSKEKKVQRLVPGRK